MTAILFDLYGTLVTYSKSRTEQGYPRSAAVLKRAGCRLGYDEWLATWASVSESMDVQADETGVEVSMPEVFAAFAPLAGFDPADERHDALVTEFLECYVDEWSSVVRLVEGVPDMLGRLAAAGHRNVLVSNTHDSAMVGRHLDSFGILPHLDHVVTSVDLGWRKPRPEIYAAALEPFGSAPDEAVFVGDTYVADYVGPTAVGIEAYLIVPEGVALPDGLPVDRRLASVLDLEARLDR